VDNPPQDFNGPTLNADPLQDREGLRRLRERDAERRSRNLQAAQDFLERPELRQGLGDPAPQGGLNPGYAEGVAPMDEDEVNHLNNPPVGERAPSPEVRNNRRRREPTEADYLNPRVWRRRAPDGAQYIAPPRDFHPSDDENEEAFRRSRQRPACQPEYVPQHIRRAVPNGREAERPEVNVPPVNHGQNLPGEPGEWVNVRVRANDPVLNRDRVDIPPVNRDHIPPRGPEEWVRARVRAQDPVFNRGRARAPTPMPARPENDENMEPEVPRMRSISLEPRGRPFFEDGGGAAAPPLVYVPAARPLGNLPKIQMPEFKGNKGVPAQMWLESLPRFQNLYQLTDAQLLEVARFSCKGEYAALWAGLLPTDLTLQDFKDLFKAEFAVENHDRLMGELLKATQKGLVGEYATDMMRYFKVFDLGEEARVRHFVRGLKFGIKETVMASGPASFLQAVKKVKEVEQAYELGDNRPPLEGLTGRIEDQVVRAVRQEMNQLKASNRDREVWENRRPGNWPEQRAPPREHGRAHDGPRARSPERNRPLNPAPVRPPPPPARPPVEENAQGEAFNGRCPRCLQRGHRVRDCPNPSAVPRHDCCGWYGRHFPGCANASAQDRERAPNALRPQGVVNVVTGFEPILPHSVEVQPDWDD
jgi:hypothetical protein